MPHVAPADPSSLFVSAGEAARMLGISSWTVYELVARGELPSRRLGTRVLIPRRALEELALSERT